VISPEPVTAWRPDYIPAYLSNGVIGLRAGPIPMVEGLSIVNGLAAIHPDESVEGFARGPYPIGGDIRVGPYALRDLQPKCELLEQRYDFSCGELHTRLRYAAPDATVGIEVLTYCSRTLPALVVQEVTATPDRACDLALSAMVDPTGVPGRRLLRETRIPGSGNPLVDGCLWWETPGAFTSCGAAYHTRFDGGPRADRQLEEHDELAPLRTSYGVRAEAGRPYRLRQLTSLVPSQLHTQPHREATRLAVIGALLGFDELRRANQAAWAEIWKGRPVLVGADRRWQAMTDAAFYYLHASAHSSSLFSTSMFGLAYWPNYHYYRGQVMWDIEAFGHPPLALTDPMAGAAVLDFRTRNLDKAEDHAALHGMVGLQFPWAAGPLHGEEALRTDTTVVNVEEHVNMAVARAFALQAHLSGDPEFARERAWPVLRGVARWIISRAKDTPRGLEIVQTLGFAETRQAPIDNSAFVNMAAAVALREAAELADRLGVNAALAAELRRAAARVFVPFDDTLGIVLNHDRFTPAERGVAGATPEALGGIFPFGYRLDTALEERTIRFYLDRVDPYVGMPMMSAPLGVFAAWIGDRDRSAALFEEGYAAFVNEPFADPHEFSRRRHPDKPVVGPFYANLGGYLQALLYGLTGMHPDAGPPEAWFRRPVAMPSLWEGLEVDRVWVRGRPVSLSARHGDATARFEG
jgi:protein-glucosylgalactosylhydroxylysine glucosidase